LKLAPSGAQSVSTLHILEHAVADVVHPASEKFPKPRHESPDPQSESAWQAEPADLRGVPLHAGERIVVAETKVISRAPRIAVHRRHGAPVSQAGAFAP
jgi:hypothetical protein